MVSRTQMLTFRQIIFLQAVMTSYQ